ncbi:MAG TPA: tetratricopeptide repeat protein [Burkholderiales bacterium]|nr:tetratricopeptide repeat protein [Burkholderiales bacterium]
MIGFSDPRRALGVLLAASVLVSAPARADDIQDASRLLKAGQHQQALEHVDKVLAAHPKDPQARFLKGLIYAEDGNSKEAAEIFLKLTQDYPELPEPYNNLAVLYAAQGHYEKARAALEQSIKTHPSYATAYENLGDVYAKLASQAYDKALQIDSANTGAKNKLALVRELVGAPPAPPAKAVAASPKEPAAPPVEAAAEPAKREPAKAAAEPGKPVVAAAKPATSVAAAEPKPAPEKPVAARSAAAPDPLATVRAWAKAWSAKDADAYLSFYAKDFNVPGGESRAQWEKVRRQRLTAPKRISVEVSAPKVSVDGSRAEVTFRQIYRSEIVKSAGTKILTLVKSDGRWLIEQERFSN